MVGPHFARPTPTRRNDDHAKVATRTRHGTHCGDGRTLLAQHRHSSAPGIWLLPLAQAVTVLATSELLDLLAAVGMRPYPGSST